MPDSSSLDCEYTVKDGEGSFLRETVDSRSISEIHIVLVPQRCGWPSWQAGAIRVTGPGGICPPIHHLFRDFFVSRVEMGWRKSGVRKAEHVGNFRPVPRSEAGSVLISASTREAVKIRLLAFALLGLRDSMHALWK